MLIDFVIAEGEQYIVCTLYSVHIHKCGRIKFLLIFGVNFTFFEIVNFNKCGIVVRVCVCRLCTQFNPYSTAYVVALGVFLDSPLLFFFFFRLKYLFNAFIGTHRRTVLLSAQCLFQYCLHRKWGVVCVRNAIILL